MKSDFRLIGLSAPKSGTLELLNTDKETFWAPFDMSDDRYKALFNWAKNADDFWHTPWIAEVEHDRLGDDGCPIGNKRIISVRQWDLPYSPFPDCHYKKENGSYVKIPKEERI